MNRKGLVAALLTIGLISASCGSLRRLGKDALITVTSPVVILYGGATDGWIDAENVFDNFKQDERDGIIPIPVIDKPTRILSFIVFPITFLFESGKHFYYCARHAFDIFLFPFYGLTELHPYGPEIEPLDIYTGTIFDKKSDRRTDAQTGVEVGGEPEPAPVKQ
jgi:hypothetical protein